jgi:hypothetical protein
MQLLLQGEIVGRDQHRFPIRPHPEEPAMVPSKPRTNALVAGVSKDGGRPGAAYGSRRSATRCSSP